MKKAIALPLVCMAALSSAAYAESYDGVYVGGYTGYAKTQSDITEYYSGGSLSGYTGDISPKSYLYGIVVGYDWKLSEQLVLGLALDYDDRDSNDTKEYQIHNGAPNSNYSFGTEVESSYSLRARLGYLFTEDALVYLTAGVVKADIEFSVINNTSGYVASKDVSYTGYNIGFGGDYSLTNNLQLFGEYRYSDYGSESFSALVDGTTTYLYDQEITENAVILGVAYNF